jgi:hypothetical protein
VASLITFHLQTDKKPFRFHIINIGMNPLPEALKSVAVEKLAGTAELGYSGTFGSEYATASATTFLRPLEDRLVAAGSHAVFCAAHLGAENLPGQY